MRYSVNVSRIAMIECGHVVVDVPIGATEQEIAATVEGLIERGQLECDFLDVEYGDFGLQVFPEPQESNDYDPDDECVTLVRLPDGSLGEKVEQGVA